MAKKVKKERVLRTYCENTMTESEFFSGFRSYLRRIWLFKSNARKSVLKKAFASTIKKYRCSQCQAFFLKKDVEVDHILSVGQLKSFDDIKPFYEKLFCDADGLRVVCKTCHLKITNENRRK